MSSISSSLRTGLHAIMDSPYYKKSMSFFSLKRSQNEPASTVSTADGATNTAVGYQPRAENVKSSEYTESLSSSSLKPNSERVVIFWPQNDPENPYNWSSGKKSFVTLVGWTAVLNSTLGSALPSGAVPVIMEEFGVASKVQQPLPISIFVFGFVLGPLLFGPVSEQYGRRTIFISTFLLLIVFTMACALAPNWPAFLFFRALAGIFGSSPIVVTGGLYADIYNDPVARGRALALFLAITCCGPVFAPIISGFITPALGWRWAFWIGLIIGIMSLAPILYLPETSGPVLLARRAAHLRQKTNDSNIFAPHELSNKSLRQLAMVVLARPMRMLFLEPTVSATCLYLSLAYGMFYMNFQAYPIIFQGIYGMSPGVSGLMFLPIIIGCSLAFGVFVAYDAILQRAKNQRRPWTHKEESRRLPLACIGGPLHVISIFWLGWAARENVHWIVPFSAGIPFGFGFMLLFMALLNYLTDAYDIYAASAMAAASCSRSLFGAVLPFAASPLYGRLGVAWGSSVLGFLSLLMCIVPFAFMRWGQALRRKSGFYLLLEEERRKGTLADAPKEEET